MFISIIQEPQLLKELKTTRIDGGWNAVTTVHKVAGFPGFFKVIYYTLLTLYSFISPN